MLDRVLGLTYIITTMSDSVPSDNCGEPHSQQLIFDHAWQSYYRNKEHPFITAHTKIDVWSHFHCTMTGQIWPPDVYVTPVDKEAVNVKVDSDRNPLRGRSSSNAVRSPSASKKRVHLRIRRQRKDSIWSDWSMTDVFRTERKARLTLRAVYASLSLSIGGFTRQTSARKQCSWRRLTGV